MEIKIKNCNSIDQTTISLESGKLNIKYGANGTGKSTIVRAIQLATTVDKDLSELTPFKHLQENSEKPEISGIEPEISGIEPEISGIDSINSVSVFNEDYVSQFVFKEDELVANSFEIFIETPQYKEKMQEIDNLVSKITETFKTDERLDEVINDLNNISIAFGKPTKSGDISGSAPFSKAVGKNGNKILNVPDSLINYTPFLQSQENVKWIDWQIKGKDFLEISNDCPYCTSPTTEKKDTILAVSKEYDKKTIEHLNGLLKAVARLGMYFSPETKKKIEEIVSRPSAPSKEDRGYISNVGNDINMLKDRLLDLKRLSFFSFKDDDDVEAKVRELTIDLTSILHMNSGESKSIVDRINQSLEDVLNNISQLKGQINQQRSQIQKTVERHKTDINSFLKYAGYSYVVDIEEDGDIYKMRLKHKDYESSIRQSSRHLSYGERNAFSLVLFMYECLSKNPDLIILDDPISSFDRNKKFAIIEMLFKRKESFKNKTVIMMTHDFEPIVDIMGIPSLKRNFHPVPKASFLSNRKGILTEIPIESSDILSFACVCRQNIKISGKSDIIKLVYLRRYFEIIDNKGNEYHFLSSLLHKREKPSRYQFDVDGKFTPQELMDTEISKVTANIRKEWLESFDYANLLKLLKNDEEMISIYTSTDNYYEKLQIYRIIKDGDLHESDVIRKFINETFHIENEYVMQLNPTKYDFIPEYIIDECDNSLSVSSSDGLNNADDGGAALVA